MKTKGTGFKVVSIVAMVVAVPLLCILLLQMLQGSLSLFQAFKVTYDSENAAEVAHVRNFEMILELSLLASFAVMFVAGLFGLKSAKQPQKTGRCLLCAAVGIVCFVGAFVFYETLYISLFNQYDIYPLSGASLAVPILLVWAVYVIFALSNKKRINKTADTVKTGGN